MKSTNGTYRVFVRFYKDAPMVAFGHKTQSPSTACGICTGNPYAEIRTWPENKTVCKYVNGVFHAVPPNFKNAENFYGYPVKLVSEEELFVL